MKTFGSERGLGIFVARCRSERQMSQRALGELAGCTRQYIAQLEMGLRSKPSYRIIMGLANALAMRGAEREDFLALAGYPENKESYADRGELTQAAVSAICSVSYPAYVHDNLWRLYGWNKAAEQLFGVSPNHVALYSTSLMEFVFDPQYRNHIVPWDTWVRKALAQFRHDCRTIEHLPSSQEVMERLRRLPDFRRMWNACDPAPDAAPLLRLTFHDRNNSLDLTIVRMQFPGPPDLWVKVFVPLSLDANSNMPHLMRAIPGDS